MDQDAQYTYEIGELVKELAESKWREAELQGGLDVLGGIADRQRFDLIEMKQERDQLAARVKSLEDVMMIVLQNDECGCDTSVCYSCRTGGWTQVSPATLAIVRQALGSEGAEENP